MPSGHRLASSAHCHLTVCLLWGGKQKVLSVKDTVSLLWLVSVLIYKIWSVNIGGLSTEHQRLRPMDPPPHSRLGLPLVVAQPCSTPKQTSCPALRGAARDWTLGIWASGPLGLWASLLFLAVRV